jgi:hypothetical protein
VLSALVGYNNTLERDCLYSVGELIRYRPQGYNFEKPEPLHNSDEDYQAIRDIDANPARHF